MGQVKPKNRLELQDDKETHINEESWVSNGENRNTHGTIDEIVETWTES